MSKPIVTVPASSTDLYQPEPFIINPNGEKAVDLLLGTDSAVNLAGLVRPGAEVGDELIIRLIRRASHISNGVDISNKATLTLKTLVPGSLQIDDNYLGFGRLSYFSFPAFSIEPNYFGPAIAIFRWTGTTWLQVVKQVPQAS
ncbi:hypothetical protein HOU03_gp469 [Caulobacter phage CcrSC]|uniref:Uncharacterized protein n=1 Tax=Caulobacter phage CcrSC TaxID=2283272 RepID=A0A385EG15_9CAUD|nr:hypothetical protein HOU03_gp469 [Caulobacter phage CcrSC]AXQ69798.1 hypothetical protein CcrSC_gp216c [Caulobacter phage CcrSC]